MADNEQTQGFEGHAPNTVMDLGGATAELFAALAKAQGEVETLDKDGYNKQHKYHYSTSEAVARGSRDPLTANGFSLFSTWFRTPTPVDPGGDIGNQFVCATVVLHWVLSHASGGFIRGTAELDAIASKARPPDKAVAATITFMRGFLTLCLLNMDRGAEDLDSVDGRDEGAGWSPPRQQGQRRQEPRQDNGGQRKDPPVQATRKEKTEAQRDMAAAGRALRDEAKEQGIAIDLYQIAGNAALDGQRWHPDHVHTDAEYAKAAAAFRTELDRMMTGEGETPAETTVCDACNRADGEHAEGCPEAA